MKSLILIRSILSILLILGGLIIVDADNNLIPTTYISFVDDGLGFYKVRNLEIPPRSFTYKDHTLNINQGDTMLWQNDAESTTFTIMSDPNLWDSTVGYLRVGSKLNYKFDKPGTYNIYIKEYTSRRQTIIVNAIDGMPEIITTVTTVTPILEPIPTITPIPTTPILNRPAYSITPKPTSDFNLPTINLNISGTMIASIIVSIISIFIAFRVGRNKN